MKSALEIAMEKTSAIGEEARRELEKLTPGQKSRIEEIKKRYEGKIAEKDVLHQQELSKMTGGAPIEAVEAQLESEAKEALAAFRRKFREDRDALEAKRDAEIEAIRKEG